MTQSQSTPAVVTEEFLIKSLTDLETKVPAVQKDPETPTVAVETLTKSAADALAAQSSAPLRKAIEVSEVLRETVEILGDHVDQSLAALQKSIQSGAERDLAIVRVLGDLRKSIDANTEQIASLMNAPAAPAATRPVTVTTGQVLTKSVQPTQTPAASVDPRAVRQTVLNGLETLVKSAAANKDQASVARYSQALVKFESTGTISDADMAAAAKA